MLAQKPSFGKRKARRLSSAAADMEDLPGLVKVFGLSLPSRCPALRYASELPMLGGQAQRVFFRTGGFETRFFEQEESRSAGSLPPLSAAGMKNDGS